MTPERLAEIRAARAATSQGRWHWTGNTRTNYLTLSCWVKGMGRTTVMDFTRWGMRNAQPRFRISGDWLMRKASDLAVWEVNRQATDPADPSLYRHDVVGIRHPDATFIAEAPGYVDDLLAEVDRLAAEMDAVTFLRAGAIVAERNAALAEVDRLTAENATLRAQAVSGRGVVMAGGD